MSTLDLRAEARIPVTQRGKLCAGGEWFPCMVLDMSSSGFLMVSTKLLAVGQILEFRGELYPEKFLDCMLEVIHANEDGAGMMITEIDDIGTRLLQVYLEEKYAVQLDTAPKARRKEEEE